MVVRRPRPRFGLSLLAFQVGDKVQHRHNPGFPGVGEVVEVRPHKILVSLVVVQWPGQRAPVGHDPKDLTLV